MCMSVLVTVVRAQARVRRKKARRKRKVWPGSQKGWNSNRSKTPDPGSLFSFLLSFFPSLSLSLSLSLFIFLFLFRLPCLFCLVYLVSLSISSMTSVRTRPLSCACECEWVWCECARMSCTLVGVFSVSGRQKYTDWTCTHLFSGCFLFGGCFRKC